MTETTEQKTKLDNLYLKFFKYAIVSLMTLALLSIIVLLPLAAYNYFQTPLPPAPAKAPPERTISVDDLKKFLIDEEKRRQELEKSGSAPVTKQPVNAPVATQLFKEQQLALYRCAEEFRRLAEIDPDTSTEAEINAQGEKIRADIEHLASHQFRGPNWPAAMVTFACAVLKNPEIVKLTKDKAIGTVVKPAINFHAQAWANIEKSKFDFIQAEEGRVAREVLAEEVRVGIAKARAIFILSLVGGALLFFLVMALYLIFAKIEDNLALIHQAILSRTLAPSTAG